MDARTSALTDGQVSALARALSLDGPGLDFRGFIPSGDGAEVRRAVVDDLCGLGTRDLVLSALGLPVAQRTRVLSAIEQIEDVAEQACVNLGVGGMDDAPEVQHFARYALNVLEKGEQ